MNRHVGALVFVAAMGLAPAAAQTPQITVVPQRGVTADDAREIAAMHGVARVDSIEMNRLFNQWQVDGYDWNNRYVEMDIDPNTGTILRLER